MFAIDTNLVVRYLTADDPEQHAKSAVLIEGRDVFICTTVLLESEWVLRSVYGYAPSQIVQALNALAGLSTVTLENADLAAIALDWLASGMDFADALHLASAKDCAAFVTFDHGFVKKAAAAGDVKVRLP